MTETQIKYWQLQNDKAYKENMVRIDRERARIANEEAKIHLRAQELEERWQFFTHVLNPAMSSVGKFAGQVASAGLKLLV